MTRLIKSTNQKLKIPLRFILIFAFLMLLGFVPWEHLLSIQITNNILIDLTSASIGLAGLIGLISTVLISVMRNCERFSGPAMLLLPFLLFPLIFVLVTIYLDVPIILFIFDV